MMSPSSTLKHKNIEKCESEGIENYVRVNINEQTEKAKLISDKINFNKNITSTI